MASFTQKLIISLILLVVLIASLAALGGSVDILGFDMAFISALSLRIENFVIWQRILVASIVVIAILCTLYAIWATWYGSARQGYIVGNGKDGNTRIDRKSIDKTAETFIQGLDGVKTVHCFSHDTRRGVRISCKVGIDADTNVASLAERIQIETRQFLEEHTGIAIESVRTIIRIAQTA